MRMNEYKMDIGLEIHIELSTDTKIFCKCSTQFGCEPNVNTCPVCTGMPGTLPVLNKQAVRYAAAVGDALNCKINTISKFDRKNYYYPDNPQNYQITQFYTPICENGYLEIDTIDGKKNIGIREIHMEEDAGKLLHNDLKNVSFIDYNRAGVPLIEIVTMPDFSNGDEVTCFLEKLRLIIQYLQVSDCKLNEGSMRVDVNLSVRKKECEELGTRTEMKNLNSFRAIKRAIDNEASRQIEVLKNGGIIDMETRRWDDLKEESFVMRSKEEAKDYRYFPEPDLPMVYVDDAMLKDIELSKPQFRHEKIDYYINELKIPEYDAKLITLDYDMTVLFEETVKICDKPKNISNWLIGEANRILKEKEWDACDIKMSPKNFAMFVNMVSEGIINSNVAKVVFEKMFLEDINPEKYVEENGLKQNSDGEMIKKIVQDVINDNEQSVRDYKAGKDKAIGYLVGQVMKKAAGKANPKLVNELLLEELRKDM